MSSKRAASSNRNNGSLLLNATNRPTKLAKKNEPELQIKSVESEPPEPTDHYLITEIKGDAENEIDFVLTEDRFVSESGPPAECLEEIHYDELHVDESENVGDTDDNVDVREIIEHVCGKCFKSFRLIKALKHHLSYCVFNSEMVLRREEMLKNIKKIEKEAVIMEKKDTCFCCGDSYDTCHLGHINCTECPKTFKTQITLERHMFLIHSESHDFPCTICNARIRTESLLKLHIEQHKNRGKPFACKSCGKDFTRQYHLKRHHKYSSCGDGQAEIMSCKVCNKEFFRLDNLRVHLKSHLGHGTPKKAEYTCPCCKKCFYSLSTLNIHIRTHTGERPFDCDLCEKNFPSLVALKKHRRYHTGEKPYTCEVCGQNFAVKEVLNRHMKRHTGEKPHVCVHCNKRFIQATQLKNHLRTHERPFECTQCSDKFKTEKQFEKHYKSHSRQGIRKIRNHCEDCKLEFSCKAALIKHEKSAKHIENSTKSCLECGVQCMDLNALQFHMLKDHETSEYVCKSCGVVFDKYHLLHEHIVTAHDSNLPNPAVLQDKKAVEVEAVKTEQDECIVIEEFIVESFATEKDVHGSDQTTFTVIAKNNEVSPDFKKVTKETIKKSQTLRSELKKSLTNCLQDEPAKKIIETMSAEDEEIRKNVGKLLDMLVDVETLSKFGWPEDTVENVLCKVIENCGYNLYKTKFTEEYGTRMREFVKLLFTVVIQNDSIKELLNNYPIDEVIEFVLSNDDD